MVAEPPVIAPHVVRPPKMKGGGGGLGGQLFRFVFFFFKKNYKGNLWFFNGQSEGILGRISSKGTRMTTFPSILTFDTVSGVFLSNNGNMMYPSVRLGNSKVYMKNGW